MERALCVTVDFGKREAWTAEERSAELIELARSALIKVARQEIVKRHEPSPACFIGSGKAEEYALICRKENINVVIFNNDLTPSQQKNLEAILGVKSIDRTQLILDIFARRAHSNEGKLQVELAQLSYMLPRLVGKGIYMSRPGGGIGTSGPGEQKLEVDRRRIRSRIFKLKKELETLKARRRMMRTRRTRFALFTIAIVGYTNAGKSTLLNALTGSDVAVRDKLFATLDPTVRKFVLPNKQSALFVDTVGFINELPHHLIEAFKATLEEVTEADLLLHVIDASHSKAAEQASAVRDVLSRIDAADKPMITVLNKIDKVNDPSIVKQLEEKFINSIAISALRREGLDELVTRVLHCMVGLTVVINIKIPAADINTLAIIEENGLIRKRRYIGDELLIEAEVPTRLKDILEKT